LAGLSLSTISTCRVQIARRQDSYRLRPEIAPIQSASRSKRSLRKRVAQSSIIGKVRLK
jgi:hypothetical protein